MSTLELKILLVDKIQKTENDALLEEVYRLMELESTDIEIYNLAEQQLNAILEAKEQIANGLFLSDEASNKEIDEWLGK